jgi:PAS domain S-box-containing protein
MKKDRNPSVEAAALRLRAEAHPEAQALERRLPQSVDETRRLLHELQVHQIEMEMQNAELLRTREEFELSRNKYVELYELAPVGFFTFDQQGVILEVNLTGARLLGTTRKALVKESFPRFIADDEGRKLFTLHLQAVLNGKGAQTCELDLVLKDGSVMCGKLQSISVQAADSKNSYLLCSLVDGTQAKRLETEIQNAREYAENIVETVRAPLVVLDGDLKILTANGSFYHTFQAKPADTVGRFIYDLGDGQWDIPKLRLLFEDILPKQTVFNGYEVEHDFPRIGHKIILLNARQIFRGKVGSQIILLGMEDITERRLAENRLSEKNREIEELNGSLEIRIMKSVDELRQKDKMLILHDRLGIMGEMIDNMARQWSEPMNSLEVIVQQVPLYYDSGEFREFFRENASKAMELIQNMSKTIEDFKTSFRADKETVLFSVNQLITRTLHLVEKSFKDQNISIEVTSEGEPMANGYPNEYSQVLLNILMNARDALVAHEVDEALISIHSFAEGSTSVVTISDNAGGIPEEMTERIFDPYFTTKGPERGTGIGLFMSKAIIEKNLGGRLTVCNAGSGAMFRIEV